MLCVNLDGRVIWGRMDTDIYMAESLHCLPETTTALLMAMPQHKIKSLKFEKNEMVNHIAQALARLHPYSARTWFYLSTPAQPQASVQEMDQNYCTIALISHASKVLCKILQARLQQYVNCELPDVQAGFRKGRRTRDLIANICWIIEKTREFQKNIYFCFIDYTKAFDCVDHNKLWKILQETGIPDHLT